MAVWVKAVTTCERGGEGETDDGVLVTGLNGIKVREPGGGIVVAFGGEVAVEEGGSFWCRVGSVGDVWEERSPGWRRIDD